MWSDNGLKPKKLVLLLCLVRNSEKFRRSPAVSRDINLVSRGGEANNIDKKMAARQALIMMMWSSDDEFG